MCSPAGHVLQQRTTNPLTMSLMSGQHTHVWAFKYAFVFYCFLLALIMTKRFVHLFIALSVEENRNKEF
jgi:hypothetical protein